MSGLLFYLPASLTLSYNWNFGRILGFVLFFQILSGLLLSVNYLSCSLLAFESVQSIMYSSWDGFFLRVFHFNGASLFFTFIYLHILKGLLNGSFRLFYVWVSGVTILLLLIITAFLGYVLPWAQMSFWACTVITNLVRVLPYVGVDLILWIWAGFAVNRATLGLFFVLHFLFPFVVLLIVILHLSFLHFSGSSSSNFLMVFDSELVKFYPYYFAKDGVNLLFWGFFFVFGFLFPFLLGDAEMFIEANSLVSPVHIVPEWYFLFAYAILRSIPNKLLGVLALAFRVIILYFFVLVNQKYWTPLVTFWLVTYIFVGVFMVLTWIGQCAVEYPFIGIGAVFTFLYFSILIFIIGINLLVELIYLWAVSLYRMKGLHPLGYLLYPLQGNEC